MIKNLTFGADPEYFIRNKNTGKIVSSIPIINGTKEEPEPLGAGFFILKDNILAEGNVPPVKTINEFIWVMYELKRRINDYIQTKYPVLEVHHADCLELDMAFLSHPEALQFGCSPYFNAWDDESHRANDLSEESFRTCGAHYHIGYDVEEGIVWSKETINSVFAKAFDIFLTIPSCLVHVDRRRFENYGGLGQYRDTTYGLECRSLGGFFANPDYASWIYLQLQKLISFIQNEENFYRLMYMEKPNVSFKGGIFGYESAPYEYLKIPFEEQLIKTNKTINV
jgi:hypothetical protein